jgi:hypothetical protein
MKHKVTCMDCGKTAIIEVKRGKKIRSDWWYYRKININACQTSKYFLKIKDQSNPKWLLDKNNVEKVPNSCYDPKVKPKYVELWECPDHHQRYLLEDKKIGV